MSNQQGELRFEFGVNWQSYLNKYLSPERVAIAREHLLSFVGRDDLKGMRILDIGCGSGIHSMAAYEAGANEVVSFDYDRSSVSATQRLHTLCQSPPNWRILKGSVLDADFMSSLGQFDLVYSWGVLHHTGDVWLAIEKAVNCVNPGGLLYMALYDSDWSAESPEFWYRIKRHYTASRAFVRRLYEVWYVAHFVLRYNPFRFDHLWKHVREYKNNRGMDFYHDVKDWLGGWPMEYTRIYEVIPFLQAQGMQLMRAKVGEANTEYLFTAPPLRDGLSRFSILPIPDRLQWQVTTIRDTADFSKLNSNKPVFVYGAGKGGTLVRAALEKRGVKINSFITTSESGKHDGLPVLSLKQFIKSSIADPQIVIASAYFDAISLDLASHSVMRFFNAYPYVLGRL